jgi:hypothetical protein
VLITMSGWIRSSDMSPPVHKHERDPVLDQPRTCPAVTIRQSTTSCTWDASPKL